MKQTDKQLIVIFSLLLAGSCILSALALLGPKSPAVSTIALIAGPLFLLIAVSVSAGSVIWKSRLRKKELKLLQDAINGRFPENMFRISDELKQLLTLIREEQSRIRLILTDHGETSELVSMNLERVILLTDRMSTFIRDVDKLASRIRHLYQRLENSLLQAGKQEDLSETILKIRFELDHFSEAPSAMLNLLKKVYTGCQQNREALITAQESFLGTQSVMTKGELSTISKQQKALSEIEEGVHKLEEAIRKGENAVREGETAMGEINAKLQHFSIDLSETSTLANELPQEIHKLSALITELEDVHEKSKILALNAAIYAGDAGEEGKGFSTIAREMKTITESAEILQQRLKQGLAKLEKTTVHTIDSFGQLLASESSIENFSLESKKNYEQHLAEQQGLIQKEDTLSIALHQIEELIELHEKTSREKQSALNRTLSDLQRFRQGNEDEKTLKFQIDNMVIQSAQFSEKIKNELPNLLAAVGGILDEVSAFQDQFLQTRNALAEFTDPQITETLKELKQAIGGNEVQLLRSSANLLRKLKITVSTN